jgi:chemosensory pili system protein ChpC
MSASNEELKCILLTLQSENVIVPNASIAEIIPSRDVIEVENSPEWMLGKMNWRGVDVPLIAFESASGGRSKVTASTQIAVMYGLNKDSEYPYIGLAISGVPHVSYFKREQIVADEMADNTHPMVAQKIRVNGAAASILDIEAMEEMVQNV